MTRTEKRPATLRRVTASALQRVIACPASEALPHVDSGPSQWSEAGHWRHWYLQHVGNLGEDLALDGVPEEHRDMCAQIDLEGLPTDLETEVAFAYNWRTGEARELGSGLERDYSSCGPDEIAGTIDAVGLLHADDAQPTQIYVGDYKGHTLVEAEGNAQLLFAAMCASKVHGIDSAVLEIINIRGGTNWRSVAEVDTFDLAGIEQDIGIAMQAVQNAKTVALAPSYTEGHHCRYCPGFDSCPAKTQLVKVMIDKCDVGPLTPELALQAYTTWRAISAAKKVLDARMYAYAAQHPIDLGDGTVFGEHSKKGRESIDGDAAYVLLRERFGQEAADIAVSRKATKAGIGKAVRAYKAAGKLEGTQKAAEAGILDALRQDGAITTSEPKAAVEVHRPRAMKS